MPRGCAVLAVILLLAGTARADDVVDGEAVRPARTRLGVAFSGGPMLVGPVAYSAAGVELELGQRVGPVWVFGRGAWGRVQEQETMSDEGDVWRYGAAVRASLARLGLDRIGGGMHLWADAGLSRRVIYWDQGGRLSRAEGSLGVGFDGEGCLAPGRYITFGMSLRALFAEPIGPQRFDPGIAMLIRVGFMR